MAKIKIRTTQNIDIEYDIAHIGERILAYTIDAMIMVVYYIIINMILGAAGIGNGSYTIAILTLIPAFFYHFIMELIFDGKSVGKMVMGLKVVKIDGSQPSLGSYLFRFLFRIVECNLGVFYGAIAIITIVINGQGQRLGDIIAGTAVIKTNRKVTLRDTILRKTNPDHKVFFPQVTQLTDNDIRTIRDVLKVYRRDRNVRVLNTCGNRVATQLNIYPGKMNAVDFLTQVMDDYNHLS